jgi:hypothetical protein
MRLIASVIFILFFYNINCQNFPKLYPLNVDGSLFANIISKNDTLIVYGSTIDTVNKRWGIYLGKVDTFGKVLLDITYFDSSSHYLMELNYPILSDNNNFYITGNIYNRSNIYFKKLSENFKDIFTKEIISGSDVSYVNNLLKVNNNKYLIGGSRSVTNIKYIGFYHFLDSLGNVLLSKSINENDKYGAKVNSFILINNNRIYITGIEHGTLDTSHQSFIITIDSVGNILNKWNSKDNEHQGIRKLFILSDSSIIYTSIESKLENGDYFQRTVLIKRDKFMNVLWKRIFNDYWSPFLNEPVDLKETPDGNFILAHITPSKKVASNITNVILTCLFKFNSNGDSLWARNDTVIYYNKYQIENRIGGITVLPSGSIVVCGYSNAPIDGSVRSIAWLYKVNKDGCMDFCNTSGFLDLGETEQKVKVFPNPTTDEFTISSNTELNQVEIYNSFGQQIFKKETLNNYLNINTFDWKNGMYFITIKDNIGSIYTTKLVVHHAL